jgi:hypothetical protein
MTGGGSSLRRGQALINNIGGNIRRIPILRQKVLHRTGRVDAIRIDPKNGYGPRRAKRLRLLFKLAPCEK